jgi:hypothetical protein
LCLIAESSDGRHFTQTFYFWIPAEKKYIRPDLTDTIPAEIETPEN